MPVSVFRFVHLHLFVHMLIAFIIIFVPVVHGYRILAFVIRVFELHVFFPAHNSFQFSITIGSPSVRVIVIGPIPGIVIPVTVIQSINLVACVEDKTRSEITLCQFKSVMLLC